MHSVLRRVMHSRAAWILGVIGWIWIAGRLWYQTLSEGFTTLTTAQVTIATALAVFFTAGLAMTRGRQERTDKHR